MPITELEAHTALADGDELLPWAVSRAPQLCRIFNVFSLVPQLSGPTLDIGSGGASFFRLLRSYGPHLLPYSCADLEGGEIQLNNTRITIHPFTCDRDRLPIESHSVGLVLLCDVLEHLLVDPVWTLLEANRVLRMGGHFVISTPNATSIDRVLTMLAGEHPGMESQYKPTSIYDRHNREWTANEVMECLSGLGFKPSLWDSNFSAVSPLAKQLLHELRRTQLVTLADVFFGPDLVFVFEKVEHHTIDSLQDPQRRWPTFLYTGFECYRRRPERFPIL